MLARKVLLGQTKGYKHHPQLHRFREAKPSPVEAIDAYLHGVADEADNRNYMFDRTKLGPRCEGIRLPVTLGQLEHERQHLKAKLAIRSPGSGVGKVPHPVFYKVKGPVAAWEKVQR